MNPTMEIDHHRLDVCFVPTTDVQRPPLFDRGHPLIWIKSAVVGVIKFGDASYRTGPAKPMDG